MCRIELRDVELAHGSHLEQSETPSKIKDLAESLFEPSSIRIGNAVSDVVSEPNDFVNGDIPGLAVNAAGRGECLDTMCQPETRGGFEPLRYELRILR